MHAISLMERLDKTLIEGPSARSHRRGSHILRLRSARNAVVRLLRSDAFDLATMLLRCMASELGLIPAHGRA
jgi:hypothetical protein